MAARQEIEPARSYKPGPVKTRAETIDWDAMPDWALVSVRDVTQLTGLSRTALGDRLEKDEFPKPSKHGKDRVWSLGQVRRWCQSVTGEVSA